MAQVLVTDSKLNAIANSVYSKNTELILPATLDEIKTAIDEIVPSSSLRFQAKSTAPTSSNQTIVPDTGYAALSQVTVSAVPTEQKTVTVNGTYTPNEGYFFDSVTVNVRDSSEDITYTQNKTITPTENTQYVEPDSGDTALLQVTVNPIPSTYKSVAAVTATANDVLSGKVIVDSTGTTQTGILAVHSYYTGDSAPTASVGEDGDLYFEV